MSLPEVGGVEHPGNTWRQLLDDRGLSQYKAARAMGVSAMTLSRLVRGQGLPTVEMTVRFAQAVDADADELWGQVCAYQLAVAREAMD